MHKPEFLEEADRAQVWRIDISEETLHPERIARVGEQRRQRLGHDATAPLIAREQAADLGDGAAGSETVQAASATTRPVLRSAIAHSSDAPLARSSATLASIW